MLIAHDVDRDAPDPGRRLLVVAHPPPTGVGPDVGLLGGVVGVVAAGAVELQPPDRVVVGRSEEVVEVSGHAHSLC